MKSSDVRKIADVLSRNSVAVKNWRRFYDELELCPLEGDELSEKKICGQITEYELFSKIIRNWHSSNADEATMENLKELLQSLDMTEAAGKSQSCCKHT